jgi:MFS family permease
MSAPTDPSAGPHENGSDGTTIEIPPLSRDRRVQAWVVSTGISQAGDVAWMIGLAWTATKIGSATETGLVVGIGTLPRALMLLFGGALADRLDARRVMVAMNAARILVLLAGAIIAETAGLSIPVLVAVAVLFGLFDAVYDPASSTMPRQFVRTEDLAATSAMFQLSRRIATFAGAPIGGVLVAFGGLELVMLVDAATFVVNGLLLALLMKPRFPRALSRGRSMLSDLADGFRYLWRTGPVRTLVIALSGLNLFAGPVTAVGLVLRTHGAGWGAPSLGLFEACIGVGAAAGAVVAIRLRPERPARVGLLILVAQAGALGVVGFAPYAGIVAAMLVVGVTAGLASAFLSGAFQAGVEASYLGRMSSIVTLTDDALMPVMMIGFAAFAGGVSLTWACLIAGGGFAALVLWSAARPDLDIATSRAHARSSRSTAEASTQSGV